MTDVALAEAAPAPAGAPINIEQASHTQPLGSQTPTPEKVAVVEDKPSSSVRDAVARAKDQLKAKETEQGKSPEAAPKVEAKAEAKVEPKIEAKPPVAKEPAPRAENGTFQARTPVQEPVAVETKPTQYRDAPSRFDDAAKSEWQNAPESVKGAVTRAVKELEDGLTKYKANHERYEQFREYDDTAKANGRDLRESIASVVEFEKMVRTNPIAAIDYALREAGPRDSQGRPITLNDIVSHVSGQTTDQRVQTLQDENNQLRSEIQQMKDRERIPQMIDDFKAAPGHERFDELVPAIVPLLKQGFTLENAYEFASATTPASQKAEPKPLIPADQTALAQTQAQPKPINPAGQKSISGAPATGSDPAVALKRAKPISETSSVREALRKAAARAG